MFISKLKKSEINFGGSSKSKEESYQWFKNQKKGSSKFKNISKYSGVLQSGKLYSFNYYPMQKDLQYYDSKPLIISLGPTQNPFLCRGINLNYLPKKIKWNVISAIRDKLESKFNDREISNPFDSINQKDILIPKTILKSLEKIGINFAIRMYYINRIKNNFVFCFEDWDKASHLQTLELYGITKNKMEKFFYKQLIKSKK